MEPPEEVRADGLDLSAGFEISPFTSPVISLEFADGFPLTIHRSVLLRASKLGLLLDSSTKTIDLRQFSSMAGHALVSCLYTGRYDRLKWTGPFEPSANIPLWELKAKFEIYALARTVELDHLEEEIKTEMNWMKSDLDIFTVIDAVKEAYPTIIGNDTWFPQWIKSLIKQAFKDPRKASRTRDSPDFGDGPSVVKVLFGCMLETYADMLESMADRDEAVVQHAVHSTTPDTTVTGSYFSGIRDGEGQMDAKAVEPGPDMVPEPQPKTPSEEAAPEKKSGRAQPQEPEQEPTAPAGDAPASEDASFWAAVAALKKDKKKKKKKGVRVNEPVLEAERAETVTMLDPEPTPEPVAAEAGTEPERAVKTPLPWHEEGLGWGDLRTKEKKHTFRSSLNPEAELKPASISAEQTEPEPEYSMPAPEPEPEPKPQYLGPLLATEPEDGYPVPSPAPAKYAFGQSWEPADLWSPVGGAATEGWGKKKKTKKGKGKAALDAEVDVISLVERNDERPGHESVAMTAEGIAEPARDAWSFWGVSRETRSPRVSF